MLEHRLAKLAAAATFVLLVIGGTVNPTGSSLACPEPTLVCHGQLFPPMVGGVFYEHGHRLAAMTVGLLQIILTILLIRRGEKRMAWLLLGMVILQGLLGAITVKYKLPWFVSTAHLMLAMSYFAMLVYTAFATRPAPSVVELDQHARARLDHRRGGRGRRPARARRARSPSRRGDGLPRHAVVHDRRAERRRVVARYRRAAAPH